VTNLQAILIGKITLIVKSFLMLAGN